MAGSSSEGVQSRVSLMAGSSRGNKRKCPMRLVKDTAVCLSDLPDSILINILSFLPTKSLVSTSLLSRRWRYLWTSTPNLELHESQFKYHHEKFMNFAERALILRAGSSLVSFSLSCLSNNDESRINTWITSAIQHNVELLSLKLRGYKDPFFLPFCIFGCQSLAKLDLQMMSCIRVPSMICLPRLKHLALKRVEFADKESVEKLLSHPLLEELILFNCDWINIKAVVNVNSPKLQSLAIEDYKYKDDWSEERLVCVLGDNLKSFCYKGHSPPTQYCICGPTMQLREAEILVSIPNHDVQGMDVASKRYIELFNSLSRVQNLTLSDETAKSLYLLSQRPGQTTIPVFERVTRLNLSACNDPITINIDSAWLKMLFKRCPQLEQLNFMKVVVFESLTENLPLLRPMPSCFRTHLKKITLQRCYPECDEQANAINVLLNSAPVLEEMVVHCKWDTPTGISIVEEMVVKTAKLGKLMQELNRRPKASENCRVLVRFVRF